MGRSDWYLESYPSHMDQRVEKMVLPGSVLSGVQTCCPDYRRITLSLHEEAVRTGPLLGVAAFLIQKCQPAYPINTHFNQRIYSIKLGK